jgi:hypothetical protein
LISVDTEQNRTISFDFLPIHAMKIGEFEVKFQLYTVPGQKILKETRRSVFVADSDPSRLEANREAYEDCRLCLEENRISPDAIPFVFQFNKRDMPGATPPHELDEMFGIQSPSFLASATSGYQVFATLDRITQMILKGFRPENVKVELQSASTVAQKSPTGTAALPGS